MPIGHNDYDIFINKHEDWIYKKISRIEELKKESKSKKLDLNRNNISFREIVKSYVDIFSKDIGVKCQPC